MNTKRLILTLTLALLGAGVLSACSGAPVSNNWHGLAADAERAYLSGGSFVYAIDLKTGGKIWQYPEEADGALLYYATPVLAADGQQLLIGSAGTTHPFVSLDPATGKEKWMEKFTTSKGPWLASPLVFNDTIYAPNTDGFLYVMDMNGKESAAPVELGGALWSAPVTDGNLVYVASLDHHLHIIDPANGMSDKSVDLGGAAPSSPAVANDGVYLGSFDLTIELITAKGEKKTVTKAEDWIWGSPVLDGDTLYYADLKGNVISLNAASGKQNWNATQKGDSVVAGLLLQGNRIYIATEAGNLIALDNAGKSLWEKAIGAKIYTTPVAAGDLILVAPYQAGFFLAAYDADGKQAWTFTPAK